MLVTDGVEFSASVGHSLSAGVVVLRERPNSYEGFYLLADDALNRAKEEGRNRVVVV
jgi:PleD family two-component response regulator